MYEQGFLLEPQTLCYGYSTHKLGKHALMQVVMQYLHIFLILLIRDIGILCMNIMKHDALDRTTKSTELSSRPQLIGTLRLCLVGLYRFCQGYTLILGCMERERAGM